MPPHTRANVNSQRSVIVADDMPEICNMVAKFLEPFGYKVLAAHTGRQASKLLASTSCDALILDVLMPDGDGIEVINALRRAGNAPRILAISGGGNALAPDYCLTLAKAAGADATLTKPFDRKQLLAAIQAMLEL